MHSAVFSAISCPLIGHPDQQCTVKIANSKMAVHKIVDRKKADGLKGPIYNRNQLTIVFVYKNVESHKKKYCIGFNFKRILQE